jgi:Secretion system C-terminal sorting domain
MNLKVKLIIGIYMFVLNAHAQTYFNKLYDYDGTNLTSNHATTSIELGNGDFLVGGHKFLPSYGALCFTRLNNNGDTILTKKYYKINDAYYTSVGNSLIKCYDGNYAQSGAITDSGSTKFDLLLVKLTENGDTLWTKTYGGIEDDVANTVCQTPDSGFVLMGFTKSFSMGIEADFYMVKTDSLGNFQWQKTYGTIAAEGCFSGQITLDGGFVMSGIKGNLLYVLKTDAMGNIEWDRQVSGTAGSGFIKQLSDSTYILTGAKFVAGFSYQAYMGKLSKTGTVLWEKTYGGAGDQQFYAVPIILNDGSVVVSGITTPAGLPYGLLIKTDSLGNQQWLRTYYANISNENYVYDVKHTSDNGFILTGSGNIISQDAWVVKVDSNGCEIANCNVGFNEYTLDEGLMNIYPNPATTEIHLSMEEKVWGEYEIRIFNTLGELEITETTSTTLSIAHLSSGVYLMSVIGKDGKHRAMQRFVKE